MHFYDIFSLHSTDPPLMIDLESRHDIGYAHVSFANVSNVNNGPEFIN